MNEDDKRNLMYAANERGVFLDNKPAVVRGCKNSFAMISALDYSVSIEFSWSAINHMISSQKGVIKAKSH